MRPTYFRSPSHRRLCLVGTGVCAALLVVNLTLGVRHSAVLDLVRVLLAFLLIASLLYAASSITVDHARGELIVRNPWQRHVLAFDEIDRIALRDSRVPNTYRNNRQLLVVVRRDGSRLTMIGGCAVGTPAVTRMRDEVAAAIEAR